MGEVIQNGYRPDDVRTTDEKTNDVLFGLDTMGKGVPEEVLEALRASLVIPEPPVAPWRSETGFDGDLF